MRSGGFIIVVFVAWLAAGLWAFAKTKTKSTAAIQAALYLVSYPAAVALATQFRPLHPLIAVPLVMASIPWLLAGLQLKKVVADPSIAKPGEFVGFPQSFWVWGLAVSVAVAMLFS